MKICYLTENLNPKHGGGRYASDLISAVKKAGHDAVILEENRRGLNLFFSALKIRKYLKGCDIIHALDGYPYGIIAALANLGINKKFIVTIQGTYSIVPLYNLKTSRLLKWAYKKADKIISISRYTKNEILKKIYISNIEVINHGINFDQFHKLPINPDEKFILSVGALKRRKGYHISIPAFAEAKKELPNLRYKIVGSQQDETYFNELKNLASQYKIEKDIEFLADLSDELLNDLYRRARLFILTSVNEDHHFEGFGLVFLEAAAAGLPVIGTLGNGIEDAVKNGYNGFLIPQNNIEATAGAIVKILTDENLKKEMSGNSYNWAREHDWNRVVLKYLEVYQNLI